MESPSIVLDDVWVEYIVYGLAERSLKKTLVRLASRGRVVDDDRADLSRVLALKGINLHVKEGDRLGLVGVNGAGKTTLMRVMAGVMKPVRGRVCRVGLTSSLFDVSLGMNAEANGWDNITLRGLFLGLTPAEVRARTEEIVAFSGLTPEQMVRPVRTYSSGMQVKLAFAISTSVYPDILLLDEWIWVGDASYRDKAHFRMTDIVQQSRILVIASHVDDVIRALCNRVVCLRDGQVIADGPVEETLAFYHAQCRMPE
jgi:ABC-type polysaccharide/polyol phosphate transport system ATPase subunit